MAKIHRYYRRGGHPRGFWGRRALMSMNGKSHEALPKWVFDQLNLDDNLRILDIGCGGGGNVRRMHEMCPNGHVTGLDISRIAVEMTTDENYPAIKDGFCLVVGGNAVQMPLAKEIFDLVTAFETIYYWSTIDGGFAEAYRVLKPGGMFVVANELDGLDPEHEILARRVGPMRVYSPEEIKLSLSEAGFKDITINHDEQRGFLCVTAKK